MSSAASVVMAGKCPHVRDEALLSRSGSTFDGWAELGAERGQLLDRLQRRRLRPSGELDDDGNPVPVRRHDPEMSRRTRPRRFAL
jgi:hypothetical protein